MPNFSLNGQKKLVVEIGLKLFDGTMGIIKALVDTGAEIALLRNGLLPPHYFVPSNNPKRFVTASQAVLDGGQVEVKCIVVLRGKSVDTGKEILI